MQWFKKISIVLGILVAGMFFALYTGLAQTVPPCDTGYYFDTVYNQCMPTTSGGGGGGGGSTTCSSGYYYDTSTYTCVPTTSGGGSTTCSSGYYFDTAYNQCIPTTSGGGGGNGGSTNCSSGYYYNTSTYACVPTPSTTPPPTVFFSPSTHETYAGRPITFSWRSEHAQSCSASGGWSGSKGISGSSDVSVSQTETFILTCSGAGGTSRSSFTITVKKIPSCSTGYIFSMTHGSCISDSNYCTTEMVWDTLKNACVSTSSTATTSTSHNVTVPDGARASTSSSTMYSLPQKQGTQAATTSAITGTMYIATQKGDVQNGGTVFGNVVIKIKTSVSSDDVRIIIAGENNKRIFDTSNGLKRFEIPTGWLLEWNTYSMQNGTYHIVAEVAASGDVRTIATASVVVANPTSLTTAPKNETIPTTNTEPRQSEPLVEMVDYRTCETPEQCLQICAVSDANLEICKKFRTEVFVTQDPVRSITQTVQEDKLAQVLQTTMSPGGMRTIDDVHAYCSNPKNDAECANFLIEKKLLDETVIIEKKKVVEAQRDEIQRVIVERTGVRMYEDTDTDGISDYDELNIYRTNPNDSDTDKDGVKDGDELLAGTNPAVSDRIESTTNKPATTATPTASSSVYKPVEQLPIVSTTTVSSTTIAVVGKVMYENPKIVGGEETELLVAEEVQPVEKGTNENGEETIKKMEFKGKALPNSFVTVYVFSTPIVVTVKTDANGNWSYVLDKELEDGEHEVYVAMTDGGGKIVAKSKPLPFVKEASAVTTDVLPLLAASEEVEQSIVDRTYLYLIGLLVVVIMGGALILVATRRASLQKDTQPSDSV